MSLGVEELKRDMLKMMDKLDDHEQMLINQQHRIDAINKKSWDNNLRFSEDLRDNYKLINDRINHLFDIVKQLEKEER